MFKEGLVLVSVKQVSVACMHLAMIWAKVRRTTSSGANVDLTLTLFEKWQSKHWTEQGIQQSKNPDDSFGGQVRLDKAQVVRGLICQTGGLKFKCQQSKFPCCYFSQNCSRVPVFLGPK